jgi:hypothetical protein
MYKVPLKIRNEYFIQANIYIYTCRNIGIYPDSNIWGVRFSHIFRSDSCSSGRNRISNENPFIDHFCIPSAWLACVSLAIDVHFYCLHYGCGMRLSVDTSRRKHTGEWTVIYVCQFPYITSQSTDSTFWSR